MRRMTNRVSQGRRRGAPEYSLNSSFTSEFTSEFEGISATVQPLYDYDWTAGLSTGAETVNRVGTATRFNADGVRLLAAADTVRLDHTAQNYSTPLGVMVEPASANLVLNSADLTAASWYKQNVTIVANNGGDGLSGADTLDTITVSAAGPAQVGSVLTFPVNSTITLTWNVKAGTATWVFGLVFALPDYDDTEFAFFNLADGEVGGKWIGGTKVFDTVHSAQLLKNDIARCTMTFKTAGITQVDFLLGMTTANETTDPPPIGSTAFFDSMQFETRATGTSYIPTTTVAVSRGAETVSVPIASGSYDILVRDANGAEWRNAVTVSGGAYSVVPRTGQFHVTRVSAYAVDALTADQKAALVAPPVVIETRSFRQGLWVWGFPFMFDVPGDIDILLSTAVSDGFTDLYLYVYPEMFADTGLMANVRQFISSASAQGIKCWGLAGNRVWFSDANGPAVLYASVQAMIDHNAVAAADERFVGFQIDQEFLDHDNYTAFHNEIPDASLSTTPGSGVWQSTAAQDRDALLKDWVQQHQTCGDMLHTAGYELGTAIPYWTDNYGGPALHCVHNGLDKPIYDHVASIADQIDIMSYGTDPTAVISFITYELSKGEKLANKPRVLFGLETLPGLGADVTYGDHLTKNNKASLFADAATIRDAVKFRQSYYGFNIHHWASYRTMS